MFAVAAVGHDRTRCPPGQLLDPSDGGLEHGGVGRVAELDVVIDDDTVLVVDDLRLAAELDRFAETALGDRPGIGIMQRHHLTRPLWGGAGQTLTGLPGDLAGRDHGGLQRVHQRTRSSRRGVAHGPQVPAGVADHGVGLTRDAPGDPDQLVVDAPDLVETDRHTAKLDLLDLRFDADIQTATVHHATVPSSKQHLSCCRNCHIMVVEVVTVMPQAGRRPRQAG